MPDTPAETNAVHPELLRLRNSIDNIDAALIHLLAERFNCTQQVGHLKAREQLPPADPAREARQIVRLRKMEAHARQEADLLLDTYRAALGI